MNIKEKFIELTKQTYPHGSEDELLQYLPNTISADEFGNYFIQIGENPNTMFTCHLDTASSAKQKVNHKIDDRFIYTDGNSILGADDKAGVVILLSMIESNIKGLYYFFIGEERGCVGSRKLSDKHRSNPIDSINKVVSFDRRGYDSVITHQLSGRGCSDEFAKELSVQLNTISEKLLDKSFTYKPDPTGIYTDSAQFTEIYAECTNISVGYRNEHTTQENQDIIFLEELSKVVQVIDWENLPIKRDPKQKYNYYEYEYDPIQDTPYEFGYQNKPIRNKGSLCEVTTTIYDEEFYGYESTVTYDYNSLEITKVKLHSARIMNEKTKIDKLFTSLEIPFQEIDWDGNLLILKSNTQKDIHLYRHELTDHITELDEWIYREINREYIS